METEKAIEDIKGICEYLIESDYMSIDKSTKISLETMLREFKKQDKMIELMAEYIKDLDIDEDICTKNIINPQLCNEKYSNCKECIKQYFEKKAEDLIE